MKSKSLVGVAISLFLFFELRVAPNFIVFQAELSARRSRSPAMFRQSAAAGGLGFLGPVRSDTAKRID